jgi:hypothetical protein
MQENYYKFDQGFGTKTAASPSSQYNTHEKEDLNSFKIEKTNTVSSVLSSGAITSWTKSSQITKGKKSRKSKQTHKKH